MDIGTTHECKFTKKGFGKHLYSTGVYISTLYNNPKLYFLHKYFTVFKMDE
jgi:hypothetical protein